MLVAMAFWPSLLKIRQTVGSIGYCGKMLFSLDPLWEAGILLSEFSLGGTAWEGRSSFDYSHLHERQALRAVFVLVERCVRSLIPGLAFLWQLVRSRGLTL